MDAFEPQIRVLLGEFPEMPSTVIMERIGWSRGKTVLFDRIAALRPLYRRPDPAQRTDYLPGELAQCDLWFPPVDVPLGWGQTGRPPVLVMVCGYSRWLSAVMIPSRQGPELLAGHWQLITGWGSVPQALVWDNESAIGGWQAGRPRLTEATTNSSTRSERKRCSRKSRCSASGRTSVPARDRIVRWAAPAGRRWLTPTIVCTMTAPAG